MSFDSFKQARKVLWAILIANLGVAFLKITAGMMIKSVSLTADGFHSLTDGSSNIIGLIGIHFAAKPVDEDHPYGHRKFETLAGMLIAVMLLFLTGRIIFSAVKGFYAPVVPQISVESLSALLLTLGVNLFVSRYEHVQGKKLNSTILISDAMHTRSDVFISAGVLVTLIGIKLGLPPVIDSVTSLAVAGFVLHAAYEIFKATCVILLDRVAVDSGKVEEIVMTFNQVKNVHKIRSRSCSDDIYLDMHIMLAPETSIEESHDLTHKIEETVSRAFNKNIHVIVHVEPFYSIEQVG